VSRRLSTQEANLCRQRIVNRRQLARDTSDAGGHSASWRARVSRDGPALPRPDPSWSAAPSRPLRAPNPGISTQASDIPGFCIPSATPRFPKVPVLQRGFGVVRSRHTRLILRSLDANRLQMQLSHAHRGVPPHCPCQPPRPGPRSGGLHLLEQFDGATSRLFGGHPHGITRLRWS
jgi:hypothetical protein